MNIFRGIFLFAIFGAVFYGCTPDPVYPAIPALTFKEFIQPSGSDTLIVVYSFTDGDGDIGLPPTDPDTNMVMCVYTQDGLGVFHPLLNINTQDPLDSIIYTYRIPNLTAGQAGLEGDIYLTLGNKWLIGRDTLQFNTFLLDNSDNRSNYVRTQSVILTN